MDTMLREHRKSERVLRSAAASASAESRGVEEAPIDPLPAGAAVLVPSVIAAGTRLGELLVCIMRSEGWEAHSQSDRSCVVVCGCVYDRKRVVELWHGVRAYDYGSLPNGFWGNENIKDRK